jgi:hypothetical protein
LIGINVYPRVPAPPIRLPFAKGVVCAIAAAESTDAKQWIQPGATLVDFSEHLALESGRPVVIIPHSGGAANVPQA